MFANCNSTRDGERYPFGRNFIHVGDEKRLVIVLDRVVYDSKYDGRIEEFYNKEKNIYFRNYNDYLENRCGSNGSCSKCPFECSYRKKNVLE